jgi:hypothetical protein
MYFRDDFIDENRHFRSKQGIKNAEKLIAALKQINQAHANFFEDKFYDVYIRENTFDIPRESESSSWIKTNVSIKSTVVALTDSEWAYGEIMAENIFKELEAAANIAFGECVLDVQLRQQRVAHCDHRWNCH